MSGGPGWRRMAAAVALVAAVSSSVPLRGAPADYRYGQWHHSAIGGGGYIQNVVLCPSDPLRAYAYVDNSGIFRSDDAGRTWRIIHTTLPASFGIYDVRGLSVDPRDADRIVAAIGCQWDTPKGIYVSGDGGVRWKHALTAQFFGGDELRYTGFVLQRSPTNPDELTAASGGTGVYRSLDGGGTWTKLGLEGVFPTDLRYDRSNAMRLWLCCQKMTLRAKEYAKPMAGGFYRSDDGGASWSKLADQAPSEMVQDNAEPARLYGIFDSTRIRRSTDGGATWRDCSEGLALMEPGKRPGSIDPRRYEALAAGPDFVLTASGTGEFYRLDGGRLPWKRVKRDSLEERFRGRPWFASREAGVSGHFGSALGSITVDQANPNRWFFTDFYAVYQTLDAGRSWRMSSDGIDATVLFCLTQDPSDGGVVHLGMADNGHFLSEDGGDWFTRGQTGNQNTKTIALSRKDPQRVYAIGSGAGRRAGMKASQVWVSGDRGRTWCESTMTGLPELAERNACSIEADPSDERHVFLAVSGPIADGSGGVYESSDGGRSWRWIGQGLPEKNWYFRTYLWNVGREIACSGDGSLAAFGSAGVYHRPPGQTAWQGAKAPPGGGANEIVADPHAKGVYYLACEGSAGGVYRSTDRGATWERLYAGNSRHVAVDGARPGRLAAGLLDGIVLSTDGGKSWTEMDRRLPYRFQPLVAFAGERLLAGSVGNGCFWTPLSPAGEQPVAARPNVPAYRTGGSLAAAMMPNGSMSKAGPATQDPPDGWAAGGLPAPTPEKPAKLKLFRDTTRHKQGPASLCLSSDAPGEATAAWTLDVPRVAMDQPLAVGGWIMTEGKLELASLSIYCHDTGAWFGLINAPASREWMEFSRLIALPPGTKRIRLQLTIRGEGRIWLDEINIAPYVLWR